MREQRLIITDRLVHLTLILGLLATGLTSYHFLNTRLQPWQIEASTRVQGALPVGTKRARVEKILKIEEMYIDYPDNEDDLAHSTEFEVRVPVRTMRQEAGILVDFVSVPVILQAGKVADYGTPRKTVTVGSP